ncbi:MAG: DUF4390 domain-containing protein [Zoogloeaceae bacterium]|jgi:hypothetical protein|nr:DUF4390 domain-containing protein [Zoogloeaceae bacterium]
MRCCKNNSDRLIFWLLLNFFAILFSGAVRAEGIELPNPTIEAGIEAGYVLSTTAKINFTPSLEEVVKKGISLFFILEFELERSRWYWLNQTVAKTSQTRRLNYHALTRQYRLTTGTLHQTFPDLASALQALAFVHYWQITDQSLSPGERLDARLRMRLDTARLPKLFQVSASFGGGARQGGWMLDSGWQNWRFRVPDAAAAPRLEAAGENGADNPKAAAP